jgi:hypothetical protein
MRAGAMEAHPHSLLQLLVDANDDGRIDHHAPMGQMAHAHGSLPARAPVCDVNPDIPSLEESGRAAGGVIALAAMNSATPAMINGSAAIWPSARDWLSWLNAPESPPPRGAVL